MALFDVCVNSEGASLERLGGRAVMSRLHGMWSLGAMAGALVASALLALEIAPPLQLASLAAGLAALMSIASRGMLGAPDADAAARSNFAWPSRWLLAIGLLVFAGMTAEGAMYDWCVLYLAQELGMAQSQAALGYAAFCVAMAASRFAGDALRERFSEAGLLRAGALLAAAAMAVVLLTRSPWVALPGFALVGAGLAPVAPILYNAAARSSGASPAAAIASVTSIGYFGFMLGPPVVGGIAHAASLGLALGLVVVAALALAIGARRIDRAA
jgi:fucose permease